MDTPARDAAEPRSPWYREANGKIVVSVVGAAVGIVGVLGLMLHMLTTNVGVHQELAETAPRVVMQHRHLNHQRYTLAAIDDVIARGRWGDWAALRRAVRADASLLERVERVCRACVGDPYAQRHHFWLHYVDACRRRTAP